MVVLKHKLSAMRVIDNHSRSNIPEDVILDILLRLPTKSLIRFKSVSKSWYTLIGSSYFIKQHFNHKNNQARARLLLYHYKSDIHKCVFSLYSDTFSRHEQPNHLQFPHTVSIIGPINSIFCVFDEKIGDGPGCVTLWNPAIREFRPLPPAGPNLSPNYYAYVNEFGFGLDSSNDDYKVVWIRKFRDSTIADPPILTLISIYNLHTDSWRHFKDVDFGIVIRNILESKCNTYVNGVYYWLADNVNRHYCILGFDMKKETFTGIDVPNWITSLYTNLCLYYDDISIISMDVHEVGKSIDLWVRKEEGNWVKQLAIGPISFWDFSWPFGVWENGDLVMETNSSDLILLNPSTGQVWNLDARSECGHTRVCSYKESLVSIRRRKWY
ncbi:hypothetical protein BUALT_Bualt04G0149200 [Buddleja alternifolia]|uniref:F-box domain-containing protein n=1 Tax=Buddleja alternifolia TaxID=168488 RepID=A0AAV6XVW1_9LAMI|nr:hypothetical protein BUALT_Bualt04G0149200 [Buddleja alternifolia]